MTVSESVADLPVGAAWAQQHLNDPTVRRVAVDLDATSCERRHLPVAVAAIPGAVAPNWKSQLDRLVRDGPVVASV